MKKGFNLMELKEYALVWPPYLILHINSNVYLFSDINECGSNHLNNCSSKANSECLNTIGSYSCRCLDNFVEFSNGNCGSRFALIPTAWLWSPYAQPHKHAQTPPTQPSCSCGNSIALGLCPVKPFSYLLCTSPSLVLMGSSST